MFSFRWKSGVWSWVYLDIWFRSSTVTFQYGKEISYTTTTWSGVFTDYMNTWTHIAVVADYDTDFVTLYRNGVSLGEKNISGALFPNTNLAKRIGRYSSGHAQKANMTFDDYRIYNRSISQEEITALYQSGLQNPEHAYTSPGTYSVSQTVWNSDGSDTELKTNYITVGESLAPVAAFTADHTSICPGIRSHLPMKVLTRRQNGIGTSGISIPVFYRVRHIRTLQRIILGCIRIYKCIRVGLGEQD